MLPSETTVDIMLSFGLVWFLQKPTENQLYLVSRLGGFGQLIVVWGLAFLHVMGARMYVPFVEALESIKHCVES